MAELFGLWDHYIIVVTTERLGLRAKSLSYPALNLVSVHRASSRFESDAETKVSHCVGDAKNHTLRKTGDLAIGKEAPVFPGLT